MRVVTGWIFRCIGASSASGSDRYLADDMYRNTPYWDKAYMVSDRVLAGRYLRRELDDDYELVCIQTTIERESERQQRLVTELVQRPESDKSRGFEI